MKLKRLRCGACGKASVRLYAAEGPSGIRGISAIEARCKCGQRTRWVPLSLFVQDDNANPKSPGSMALY